ncbi:MAG TPA: hypothetical protein VJB99_00065 [Patescibacteria group bacterium]|nr:hypothetical protein [Patescibacteria group bacterium]
MNEMYPIAKLGGQVLVIDKSDLPHVGKGEEAKEVKCVRVDFDKRTVDSPWDLEKHLRFNPWEEIRDEEERRVVMQRIETLFSELDHKVQE